MDSNKLKNIIESARIARGLSQRELSKQIGLSQSTYNDTINRKIKKVDVEILKKIAEGLELSLEELLKASGYNDILGYFGVDRYKNKSTRDLKEIIEAYKKSELDILDFDAQKRTKATNADQHLFEAKENLNKINEIDNQEIEKYISKALEEIKIASELIKPIKEKHDYSNLAKIY